jgi:hypothetical protein
MALEGAGNAIGIVGGILGIGLDGSSVVEAIFPSAPASHFSNFRVHVGMTPQGDESRSTGGHAPALAAWDGSGRFVGQITPDGPETPKIKDGGFRDYAIEGTQGVEYLSVVETGNDGICIHLITGQSAQAGKYAWVGDIGKACGAPWYLQNRPIDDDSEFLPACVWIDRNADSEHIWKGFTMHLGSFAGVGSDEEAQNRTKEAFKANEDLLCASEPRFSMYEDIRIGNSIRTFKKRPNSEEPGTQAYSDLVLGRENWLTGEKPPAGLLPERLTGKTLSPVGICLGNDEECLPKGPSFDKGLPVANPTRRGARLQRDHRRSGGTDSMNKDIKRRQVIHADRLIVSGFRQHSAIALCSSPVSLGPDMVSTVEGMFCDMSAKRLWPLCADDITTYCFDMQTETVRGSEALSEKSADEPGTQQGPGIVALVVDGQDDADQDIVQDVPGKAYTYVDTWGPTG